MVLAPAWAFHGFVVPDPARWNRLVLMSVWSLHHISVGPDCQLKNNPVLMIAMTTKKKLFCALVATLQRCAHCLLLQLHASTLRSPCQHSRQCEKKSWNGRTHKDTQETNWHINDVAQVEKLVPSFFGKRTFHFGCQRVLTLQGVNVVDLHRWVQMDPVGSDLWWSSWSLLRCLQRCTLRWFYSILWRFEICNDLFQNWTCFR